MYVYFFTNDLFIGEVRKLVTNFPIIDTVAVEDWINKFEATSGWWHLVEAR